MMIPPASFLESPIVYGETKVNVLDTTTLTIEARVFCLRPPWIRVGGKYDLSLFCWKRDIVVIAWRSETERVTSIHKSPRHLSFTEVKKAEGLHGVFSCKQKSKV